MEFICNKSVEFMLGSTVFFDNNGFVCGVVVGTYLCESKRFGSWFISFEKGLIRFETG